MFRGAARGFILLALVATGCGEGKTTGTTQTQTAGSPASSRSGTPSPSGAPAALRFGGIKNRSDVLTDAVGRAVYTFSGDEHGAVTCLGACATEWPGVPTVGDAVVEGGKDYDGGSQGLGNGTEQATFSGDPLYYYSGDTAPGQTNGVGRQEFGGTFYLVTKNYDKLTR